MILQSPPSPFPVFRDEFLARSLCRKGLRLWFRVSEPALRCCWRFRVLFRITFSLPPIRGCACADIFVRMRFVRFILPAVSLSFSSSFSSVFVAFPFEQPASGYFAGFNWTKADVRNAIFGDRRRSEEDRRRIDAPAAFSPGQTHSVVVLAFRGFGQRWMGPVALWPDCSAEKRQMDQ